MPEKSLSDLVAARLDKAAKCLQTADNAIANGDFDGAANRLYYCLFHSMKAVLAFDEFRSKNHGEVIGKFRKDYIKTGIFPIKYSDVIKSAFETRIYCDYDDFYVVVETGILTQAESVREFLAAVKEYTDTKIKNMAN